MSYISAIFAWLSGLSGMVLVPFIILILALCFGVKPGTAVRSALMVGAGILAISTVSSMMIEYISPLGNALIENTGIKNDILDLSVAPVFGAVMQLPFFVFLYPIGLLINFAMLKLKWTKTINVDFLNLFAIILPALPIYLLTGNVIMTLVVSVLVYMFSLKMADWVAPMYQKYFDLEGVSIPHAFDRAAAELLSCRGIKARVVSAPCLDLFAEQSEEYKNSVLPRSVRARVAVEAACRQSWSEYVGTDGAYVCMDGFGESAPAGVLMKKYGFRHYTQFSRFCKNYLQATPAQLISSVHSK